MILTLDDLWRLGRLVPALASGLVTASLALLVARKTGVALYRSFGWMIVSFLAYGTADFMTRGFWISQGWSAFETRVWGATDIVAAAWMIRTLSVFTSGLLERPVRPSVRWAITLPLATALVTGGTLFLPWVGWTESTFGATGLAFLAASLVTTVVCGTRLLLGYRSLHDRPFRLWALATGGLMGAFVPLWVLEVLRVVQWGGFAWFFLLCNLTSLATIASVHFRPESPRDGKALFEARDLVRCATRFGWTERETEVANLHARGLSSTEISQKLFIAPKTVRNHVANLYQKTGVHQRMALVELLAKG